MKHKPKVTLYDSQGKKISASNMTVIYPKDTKSVGKHTVKIVLKGEYSGTIRKSFTVVK